MFSYFFSSEKLEFRKKFPLLSMFVFILCFCFFKYWRKIFASIFKTSFCLLVYLLWFFFFFIFDVICVFISFFSFSFFFHFILCVFFLFLFFHSFWLIFLFFLFTFFVHFHISSSVFSTLKNNCFDMSPRFSIPFIDFLFQKNLRFLQKTFLFQTLLNSKMFK